MGRTDTFGSLLGTTFTARHWLSLDPCGLCCVSFSLSLHFYGFAVASTHLISYSTFAKALFGLVYCPASILAVSSLFKAWTTDPGAVPMGARPLPVPEFAKPPTAASSGEGTPGGGDGDEEVPPAPKPAARRRGIRRCRKCNDNYKPPRAHHDSVTGRCIVKMDHFCPWVGNAVGALNHKFFFLFVLYTLMTSITSLVLIFTRVVRCGFTTEDDGDEPSQAGNSTPPDGDDAADGENLDPEIRWLSDDGTNFVYPGCERLFSEFVLILFVISVAFLFFTCCMLLEQFDAIRSGTAKIARMKINAGLASEAEAEELGAVAKDFNEMFGGDDGPRPSWHWFLPLTVRFPEGTRDAVLGYEYDPSWGDGPYREPEDDSGGSTKIVAGGASVSSTGTVTSVGGTPAAADPPLVPPAEGAAEDGFIQEDRAGRKESAPSSGSVPRKRNKADQSTSSVEMAVAGSIV